MASHKMNMQEYQQLAELLQKAKADNRLGEAMYFAGIHKEVGTEVENYQSRLAGGKTLPVPLSLNAMIPGSSHDGDRGSLPDGSQNAVAPKSFAAPKSTAQKGRDLLATMNAPIAATDSAVMNREYGRDLPIGSWFVNARGELVTVSDEPPVTVEQQPVMHEQQPEGLRWKAKWNEKGTVRAIGYPREPQQHGSTTLGSGQTMHDGVAMEVGNAKRSLEPNDMMSEEQSDWDLVHAEVLDQVVNGEFTGKSFQDGSPPPDSWWPDVDYSKANPKVSLPGKAKGSVQQWGRTGADRLPKLKELGFDGYAYEDLVKVALAGHRPLASYLGWIKSTYAGAYSQRGPSSQGLDLAGFLDCIGFETPVDMDGFRRRFAK